MHRYDDCMRVVELNIMRGKRVGRHFMLGTTSVAARRLLQHTRTESLPLIIDCFDGMIIRSKPDASLANTMLGAALETIADSQERPIVLSDRHGHYPWPTGWSVSARRGFYSRCCKLSSQDNATSALLRLLYRHFQLRRENSPPDCCLILLSPSAIAA